MPRNWTEHEVLIAMNLYCRLPFGQCNSRNKYLNEVAAIKSGYRPARGSYCSREGRAASQQLAQTVSGNVKVWVNTKSHVYHCPGARWYGNTKRGKFMSESEALSVGNRPSHGQKCN